MMTPNDILALQNLLDDSSKAAEERVKGVENGREVPFAQSPASIVPGAARSHSVESSRVTIEEIVDEPRIPTARPVAKRRPKYEVVYPAGTSAETGEDFLLKISLPGAKPAEIDFEIEDVIAELETSTYELQMLVPHRVDSDACSAKWDPKTETLIVTCVRHRG
eukprot:TRINITY_DN23063_c0_g1_i1.p2 TRINITY_DN23063_c0_g1~~TRINITY_DN23063_c0_g1_i1.p2  ORF type:complete len:164 (-),score=45.61 TRINITY_DN23063_c0_g1_i1:84-575(-)